MAFRLRSEARQWFKGLSTDMDFDVYYWCLMAGLATRRKLDVVTAETAELVSYFPGEYKSRGRLIVALFLAIELEEMGIEMSQRTVVHDAIGRLVSPMSPALLSEEGMRQFNRYAHGGFDTISEWFEERPRRLDTFLPLFKRRLDQTMQNPT